MLHFRCRTMMTSRILVLLVAVGIHSCFSLPVELAQDVSQDEYTTEGCPPGIWVCKKKRTIVEDQPVPQDSAPVAGPAAPMSLSGTEEDDSCPPGIWTCDKKRFLKKRLLEARARKAMQQNNQARAVNCPPGIWVCWERKADGSYGKTPDEEEKGTN